MTEIIIAQRMWQRRDDAATWTSVNPVLADGEIGVERAPTPSVPAKFKIGNGVTPWTGLPYAGVVLNDTDDLPEGLVHLYYTNSRADARVAAGIAAHVADADPHPQYLTQTEGDARYASSSTPSATNLSTSRSSTDVTVASDTGTDATIPAADSTNAGVMTAAMKTKLDGIATGATANSTDAALRDRSTHTGTQSADTITDGVTNKAFLATERTKLTGIATGATANSTDAALRDRSTHTGTQTASTISDFNTVAAAAAPVQTVVGQTGAVTAAQIKAAVSYSATDVGAVPTTAVGAASGVAPLGSDSKIPSAYLPTSVLGQVSYQGTWDATSGAPSATPTKGQYWIVTVAGTTSLSGITDWQVGDWAIYNGTAWNKVDNTDALSSWNGRTGAVVPQTGDYTATMVGADSAGSAAAAQAYAVQRSNHTGTQSADTLTDGTTNKAFLATERTKLAGIATGATANSTDAALRDRSTHTGTQTASTISDFATTVRATILTGLSTATSAAIAAADSILTALGKLQAQINTNTTAISGKEPTITAGTTAQFWRGDKSWQDFASAVRSSVLTGLSTAVTTAIVAGDSVLVALGKAQGQINTINTALAGKEPTITASDDTKLYRGDKAWSNWLNGDFYFGRSSGLFGSGREVVVSAGETGDVIAHISLQGSRTTSSTFGVVNAYHGTVRVGAMAFVRDGADDACTIQFTVKAAGGATYGLFQMSGPLGALVPGTSATYDIGTPTVLLRAMYVGTAAAGDASYKAANTTYVQGEFQTSGLKLTTTPLVADADSLLGQAAQFFRLATTSTNSPDATKSWVCTWAPYGTTSGMMIAISTGFVGGTLTYIRSASGGVFGPWVKLLRDADLTISNTTSAIDVSLNLGTGGANTLVAAATSSAAGVMTAADKSKLDAIDSGPTAFTPTVIGTTTAGTGTYSQQTGWYMRIGKMVYFYALVNISAHTGTGNLRLAGLPFASANTINSPLAIYNWNNLAVTAGNTLQAAVLANSSQILIGQTPSGGGTFAAVPLDTSFALAVGGAYFIP